MTREAKRNYSLVGRPFKQLERKSLHIALEKIALRKEFEVDALIRALEADLLAYCRNHRPAITGSQVKRELLAIEKTLLTLSSRLGRLSGVSRDLVEIAMAQSLRDAFRESRLTHERRASTDPPFLEDDLIDLRLLKYLVDDVARIAAAEAKHFSRRGRPLDFHNPADGVVLRVRQVLKKYGISTRPNRRTTFEKVLMLAFSATGLGKISDPIAIAKRAIELESESAAGN